MTHVELISSPLSPSYPASKRPVPRWLKWTAALTVCALIVVIGGILFAERLVKPVDYQLEALRARDIEKAYTAYTSREFRTKISPPQFHAFIERHPVFLDNHSACFTQRTFGREKGTIRGHLLSADYPRTPVEYEVIKEEGQWKILSLHLAGGEPFLRAD